jgi:hypothetical protein
VKKKRLSFLAYTKTFFNSSIFVYKTKIHLKTSIFVIDFLNVFVFLQLEELYLTRNIKTFSGRKEGCICSFCAFPTLIWRKMHLLETLIRRQRGRHKGICRACTWGIRVESRVSRCQGYWRERQKEGARIKIIPRGECHFSVFLFCRVRAAAGV